MFIIVALVAFAGGTICRGWSIFMASVDMIWRLKSTAERSISRSTGFEPYRGSILGGWNGSDDCRVTDPLENGLMLATEK